MNFYFYCIKFNKVFFIFVTINAHKKYKKYSQSIFIFTALNLIKFFIFVTINAHTKSRNMFT
jgi:hypothetical protein